MITYQLQRKQPNPRLGRQQHERASAVGSPGGSPSIISAPSGGRGTPAEPLRVIARSAATKQSPSLAANRRRCLRLPWGQARNDTFPPVSLRGAQRRSNRPSPPVSLRGAQRRSNLPQPSCHCAERSDEAISRRLPCHCAERSDEAISLNPRVIARSAATKQSPLHPVSRRGLLRLP